MFIKSLLILLHTFPYLINVHLCTHLHLYTLVTSLSLVSIYPTLETAAQMESREIPKNKLTGKAMISYTKDLNEVIDRHKNWTHKTSVPCVSKLSFQA